MSSTTTPDTTGGKSEAELVEEHYELLERIARTDLQVAERCQRALDRYEAGDLDA